MSETFDVCVVGAGAGGAVAAWALVERGARVLLVDTGPRFDPASYRTHDQDWELGQTRFADVTESPEHESYEAAPGEPLDPRYDHLRSRSLSGLSGTHFERRRPFLYSRALGLGGSTLHYQGEAHRFPAHAFRMRSTLGVAEDWPLGYGELAPYYERVERLLGVAGDPRNPFKPPRGPYPYPPHPLSPASLRVAEGARRLGWQQLPNPLAILPEPRDGRAACHYCNGCSRGCQVGAKASTDVAVIPRAERTGRLQIRTGFHVTHLDHAADGRITGVVGIGEDGRPERLAARAVVLATGAVETPRILLNSAGGAHPEGVGQRHGQVGHYFMEHLYVSRWTLFDEPLEAYAGIPFDSRIWDLNGAGQPQEVPEGIVLGQFCGIFEGPVGCALEATPGLGAAHRAALRHRFGAATEIWGVAEQLPRFENRVTLSERQDRHGFALARIEATLAPGDLEVLSASWRRVGALAEAARASEILGQVSAFDLPNSAHVGGTCRMGQDPARSVVDASGAVHGHPELVIADASVLVTQGAGDSPSLTIQALALRAAERLADRAARGEV